MPHSDVVVPDTPFPREAPAGDGKSRMFSGEREGGEGLFQSHYGDDRLDGGGHKRASISVDMGSDTAVVVVFVWNVPI